MLAPTNFPPLQLCKVCSSFFTGRIDESTSEDIHRWIWHEGKEYTYESTRRDVEKAAASGCFFCEVIGHDGRYAKGMKGDEASRKIEMEAMFRLEKQRPALFPPLDERLYFQIQYDRSRSSLATTFESKEPARTMLESGQYRYDWDLYSIKGDPTAQLVREEALIMEPGSSEVFKETLEWMNDCLKNHAECPRNSNVKLPAKLVRISPLGDSEWAKVWEPDGMEGQYCALSYCWGGDQEHKTLISRYEQYKKELPYSKLPKTVTDAFHVARAMGMEQIWIDSLCIIQDDEGEKQREIAKMMSIYQDAQFTISAACASEVMEGFLRNPLESGTGLFYHPLRINKY